MKTFFIANLIIIYENAFFFTQNNNIKFIFFLFFVMLFIWITFFFLRKKHSIKRDKKRFTNKNLSINEIKSLIEKDDYLSTIQQVVEDKLQKETFDVPELAKDIFTTRVTLYRKIKKKTGRTTVTFIKLLRLLKADNLLRNTNKSITNISYEVGFKAPSYFSTNYKKEYGCSPKDIRKEKTNNEGEE